MTRLKVSLIRASLAESRAHSFYGTISLDYPHQLLETFRGASDEGNLSQQKDDHGDDDDGHTPKLGGQSNSRENGRKAFGSPFKYAKAPVSTRTIEFNQTFEL